MPNAQGWIGNVHNLSQPRLRSFAEKKSAASHAHCRGNERPAGVPPATPRKRRVRVAQRTPKLRPRVDKKRAISGVITWEDPEETEPRVDTAPLEVTAITRIKATGRKAKSCSTGDVGHESRKRLLAELEWNGCLPSKRSSRKKLMAAIETLDRPVESPGKGGPPSVDSSSSTAAARTSSGVGSKVS
jgi:hypothetical protein